jgi:hypothetical protein
VEAKGRSAGSTTTDRIFLMRIANAERIDKLDEKR